MTRTLIAGIMLVLILSLLTVVYIKMRKPKPTQVQVPQVEVIVASTYISPGRPITPKYVEVIRMQATQVPQDAARKIDEVIMRIPIQPITKGEIIRRSTLLVPGSVARGYQVPIGERAIAIYVRAHNSTADVLMPGDIIDVFAIYEFTDELGVKRTRGSLLAQAVRVLSVDEIVETGEATPVRITESGAKQPQAAEAQAQEQGAAPIGRKPQVTMRRIVLSVTPSQAQRILSAAHAENARLDIAIRNETDMSVIPVIEAVTPGRERRIAIPQRETQKPAVVKRREKAEAKAKQIPPALMAPITPARTVTVYRGTQREEVLVAE